MGLLDRLFVVGDLRANQPGPMDDYWYKPIGASATAASGQRVDPNSAQTVSAFFRGLNKVSGDVAKVPLEIYELLSGGGKRKAKGHPLFWVLFMEPNQTQDSFEWRRQGVRDLILRGNWYNFIVQGARGVVDQLVRINPVLVTPERIASGRIVYHIRDPKTSISTTHTQDEIFHVRGVSDDGVEGQSLLTWARNSVGIALATESYAGRLFSQGTLHGGIIETPAALDKEASARMAASFVTSQSNWHMPRVLEQGAKWVESTMTPEDSQFLVSRKFSVTEMARWLGVPPHKLYDLERSTNNNIEHQGIEYEEDVDHWFVPIESAIRRQLILAPEKYAAMFDRSELSRGDMAARGEYFSKIFNAGGVTQNEMRESIGKNPMPDADRLYVPVNLRPSDQPYVAPGAAATPPTAGTAKAPNATVDDSRVRAIVTESAARLVRKETTAIQKAAVKFAADAEAFATWATEFYAGHVPLVAQTLQLDPLTAQLYCESQRDALIAEGVGIAETWDTAYLVGVALDAPRPDPRDVLLKAAIEKPVAPVHTHTTTTIEKGAISSPVDARTTVTAPTTVQPAAITFAPGAIQHTSHLTVPTLASAAVEKVVKRNAKGQIARVTETHTSTVAGAKAPQTVVVDKTVTRDATGAIVGVRETRLPTEED